ncbi:hypothetical protein WJX77_001621 [Trebouxia sp. C0004]
MASAPDRQASSRARFGTCQEVIDLCPRQKRALSSGVGDLLSPIDLRSPYAALREAAVFRKRLCQAVPRLDLVEPAENLHHLPHTDFSELDCDSETSEGVPTLHIWNNKNGSSGSITGAL